MKTRRKPIAFRTQHVRAYDIAISTNRYSAVKVNIDDVIAAAQSLGFQYHKGTDNGPAYTADQASAIREMLIKGKEPQPQPRTNAEVLDCFKANLAELRRRNYKVEVTMYQPVSL